MLKIMVVSIFCIIYLSVVTDFCTSRSVHETLDEYTLKKVFIMSKTKASWAVAERSCQKHNMHLASVRNQQEYNEFLDLAKKHNLYVVFIGLNELEGRNKYKWVSDGTPLADFRPWGKDQPEHENHGKTESCVAMTFNRAWHDYPCDNPEHFACETYAPIKVVKE